VSLLARYLEANGVPTVIMGCAKDIVEHCGVPRLLFTDFPLGNPCGEPFKAEQQKTLLSMALDLLESARAPRTTVQTPFIWPHGDQWKETFMTKEHPFLDEKGMQLWLQAKGALKAEKAANR
jgi:D-proline reductase (dithiol) PrdB